jgi:phosphoribosyl-ATP pyrophosphohydrolase
MAHIQLMKLSNIWLQKIYLLGFDMLKILEDLVTLARERKSNPVEGSYTNKLLEDKSLAKEKVLEEINELFEAVEQDTNKIHEAADVLYHLIMYLEKSGIKIEDVMKELNNRRK